MKTLLDVISLKANEDYTLELIFENNEKRVFDMSPYLDRMPFKKLANRELFLQANIEYGTVVWPEAIDIDPEILYNSSRS
jgi:hypothetical protein